MELLKLIEALLGTNLGNQITWELINEIASLIIKHHIEANHVPGLEM